MRSLLFGVESGDLRLYGLAAALLFGIAAIAAYIPARHAACIQPAEALRTE